MTTLGPACHEVTSTLPHCTQRSHSQNLDLCRTLACEGIRRRWQAGGFEHKRVNSALALGLLRSDQRNSGQYAYKYHKEESPNLPELLSYLNINQSINRHQSIIYSLLSVIQRTDSTSSSSYHIPVFPVCGHSQSFAVIRSHGY